jgi:hypothetical protein
VQKFDFDILGFAWLLSNAPKLSAFVIMVLCLTFSAYFWLRASVSRQARWQRANRLLT